MPGMFTSQETIAEGGAALLSYNPRYLHCDWRGFYRRFGHAVLWSFLTKNDSGLTRAQLARDCRRLRKRHVCHTLVPVPVSAAEGRVRIGNQQAGLNVGIKLIREFRRVRAPQASGSPQRCGVGPKVEENRGKRRPQEAGRGYWELMGVCVALVKPRNPLRRLVAGVDLNHRPLGYEFSTWFFLLLTVPNYQ